MWQLDNFQRTYQSLTKIGTYIVSFKFPGHWIIISYLIVFFDRIELQNVWGHVNMFARGAGQAVAQLDVNYGVDFEPFKVNDRAHCLLKFRYCEKATKFEKDLILFQKYLFSNVKTKWEIFLQFCGLLWISELYSFFDGYICEVLRNW